MMNNNNHQNSECTHAAEIVSYIYDEIGAAEKSVFEAHLASCATCPEELADFIDVRFAVAGWKETEFAPLATPVIEIPYETEQTRETVAVSGSWWSNLRGLLTLSPAWTASAATAALVICFGTFFAISRFSGGADVAELDNKSKVKPTASPTTEALPRDSAANNNASGESSPDQSPGLPNVQTKPESDAAENVPETKAVKISERTPRPRAIPQNSAVKTNNPAVNNSGKPDARRSLPVKNQPLPKLNNFEDDEDDSLRLAELFDEIDTLE